MANTETGIVNSALAKCAEPPIDDLAQAGTTAAKCRTVYEPVRDDLLRKAQWNFALKRQALARDSTAPVFGWDYAYVLPVDCLRVVDVFGDSSGVWRPQYKLEGERLLADAESIYLSFVRQVTDPNDMTPDFREALAWALAAIFATSISASNTLRDLNQREAREAFNRAASVDAIEDWPEELPDGSWVTERQR